jgi:hypothetical protein
LLPVSVLIVLLVLHRTWALCDRDSCDICEREAKELGGSAAPYRAHQTVVSNRTKKYVHNSIKLGQMSEDLIAIIS